MKLIVISFLSVIVFSRCSKMGDTEKPTINISSPTINDTISGNEDEVIMQFTATDNESLSTLVLEIQDTNGVNLFADSKQIFGTNYSYKNSFLILKHPLKTKELFMTVHISDESHNEHVSSTRFFLAPKN